MILSQVVQGGNQFAFGQIARGPEDNDYAGACRLNPNTLLLFDATAIIDGKDYGVSQAIMRMK